MINKTEVDERTYLEDVKGRLQAALEAIDARVRCYAEEVQEQKDSAWEARQRWTMSKKSLYGRSPSRR